MVQSGAEWCNPFNPLSDTMAKTAERVRFTIAVDDDVYEAFSDLAHSSGVSLSRCIGDWLRDTAEAAQMTTIKVQQARRSPQEALDIFIRDGMVPEMLRLMDGGFKSWGRGPGAAGAAAGGPDRREQMATGVAGRRMVPAEPAPPSSNTGGKSPGKTRRSS